uniref:Coiled-coil domain-containing protein n=1 Tax=Anopheles culicifacies TaxID=139723 RepID=A0A182M111_9DIPT
MDVAGASLELHSNDSAQVDAKSEENKWKKAIQVSTAWDTEESDAEDEDSDHENDENVAELCTALSKMSIVNMEGSPNEKTETNALLDAHGEKTVSNDDIVQEHHSENDEKHGSKSDGYDNSDDSSNTLDLSSEDESERRIDRGGGDADVNLGADTKQQVIKVIIAPKKRERDPEAYKKWLKTKNEEIRKNREKEILTKQELQRQKELEEEKRKEINKKKIQAWMERKKQDAKKSNAKPVNDKSADASSEHLHSDPDAKFKHWLLKVKKQEEEKRLHDLTLKQREQQIKQEKKKMSDQIYQQWLKHAKHKPKPVPLNQGPNTLRGTVSKLVVNPEPWKSNCD